MYRPVQDGMEKTARSVLYREADPPGDLTLLVHSFWELKTTAPLPEDFRLHALPDACVNILFNLLDTDIAGITALRTAHEVLNLGRTFHYAGVQLWPGVWRGDRQEISDRFVGTPYRGDLPLAETGRKLVGLDFTDQLPIYSDLVRRLAGGRRVAADAVTGRILARIDDIRSVADMAAIAGISTRQLQRTLRQTTGLSPHDLLKILRLQRSFREDYLDLYADQAHFIHSFRRITGHTPGGYARKFLPGPGPGPA